MFALYYCIPKTRNFRWRFFATVKTTKKSPPSKQKEKWRCLKVKSDEDGMRLDRWIHNHYPSIPNSLVHKLLRKKKLAVSDNSVLNAKEHFKTHKHKANDRLKSGQYVFLPVSVKVDERPPRPQIKLSSEKIQQIQSWVLHKDKDIIVLNKPPKIAVQGGSGIKESLTDYLHALKFENEEPPKLIHRLDQATSGILVLARNRKAAQVLTKTWAAHRILRLYWAILIGKPKGKQGIIDISVSKSESPNESNEDNVDPPRPSKKALTKYRLLASMGNLVSFVALLPKTGRTHQIRIHCAKGLNCPILGETRYSQCSAENLQEYLRLPKDVPLHLHAREICFLHPTTKKIVQVAAPVPTYFAQTLKLCQFNPNLIPTSQLDDQEIEQFFKTKSQKTRIKKKKTKILKKTRDSKV